MGGDGSIATHQDALLCGTLLGAGDQPSHLLDEGRRAYVHLVRGSARVNGETLDGGDGMAIEDLREVRLEGVAEAELLLFDLP